MEWKDVVGYEGLYEVSNIGEVRSVSRLVIFKDGRRPVMKKSKVKSKKTIRGYYAVDLYKKDIREGKLVHRLVAEAFLLNPEYKPTVNHKNAVKKDNRVENLEWATMKEQSDHVRSNGLIKKENMQRSIDGMRKANSVKVVCLNTGEVFDSVTKAAIAKNTHHASISRNCQGKVKSSGKDNNGCPLKWSYYHGDENE